MYLDGDGASAGTARRFPWNAAEGTASPPVPRRAASEENGDVDNACLPACSFARSFVRSLTRWLPGWLACLLVGWSLGRALRVSFGREPLNSRRRLAARSSLRTHSRPTFQRAFASLLVVLLLAAGRQASQLACLLVSIFVPACAVDSRALLLRTSWTRRPVARKSVAVTPSGCAVGEGFRELHQGNYVRTDLSLGVRCYSPFRTGLIVFN